MLSVLVRAFRLIKIGAIGGLAVGVVRLAMSRRRPPVTGEASWPSLAEPIEGSETPATRVDRDQTDTSTIERARPEPPGSGPPNAEPGDLNSAEPGDLNSRNSELSGLEPSDLDSR